ncbi:MAG: sigma-54-dependent Fis family transcriptional regulator [Rhodospirillales bacterium]|nr:sigma-54-dependent Fis family transcriptional regulator [Rhodospirillales bacterium]MSP80715.1 sigma-54-dependent Fis family transcriptional regulator [Rhodospirillales bacterium]
MAHDILIVDDEADIRGLVSGILADEGFQVREAATSAAALQSVESRRPSLVLLDIWLQGSALDGLGILKEIKRDHPTVPVLMMSGHGTIEVAVSAIKLGAYDFIEKPFKADRLLLAVERAIQAAQLKRENEELRLRVGIEAELIGESHAIRDVLQAIGRVAPANSRVLIAGPAGSGKEVAARMIHAHSRRSGGPFVVLNCASLGPEHFEEELFGVDGEGAAGADGGRARHGILERAHTGTLLLDEVADMPIETQGKIVRVLQDQVFHRVGGRTAIEVDMRVFATSTRDLGEEVKAGRMREDLFYRLNVVPVVLPALRTRRGDIPLLAKYFMARAANTIGQPPREFTEDAIALLQSYDWPGNVRELRNIVERLLILAPGDPLQPINAENLPPEIGAAASISRGWEQGAEIMGLPLREARENFEREYLLAQISRFGGNISRTASFVGMERSALHRKLKMLGVNTEEKQPT